MTSKDYLKTAQKRETRRQKVEWLFLYFKSRHIKHTYNTMIEYICYTDEQTDLIIEDYLERERVLEEVYENKK